MRLNWIKVALAGALVAGGIVGVPQTAAASTQSEFIAKLVKGAQQTEREKGIPASVTIGMAALETGWGRSTMAAKVAGSATSDGKSYVVNTLFNIKCSSKGTHTAPYQSGCVPMKGVKEYRADGSVYYTPSYFARYSSWTNSMLDFGRLLSTASRYAPAFQYTSYPDQFVTEVRKGGYATDPNYATLVISIMKSYNLYQYNVNGGKAGIPTAAALPFPVVVRGNNNETIKTLQRLLNTRLGEDIDVIGQFGPATEAAVRKFQDKKGLAVDGQVGAMTWAALITTLKSGASNRYVEALQHELKNEGYRLDVTGTYDSSTVTTVKEYQVAKNMTVNGQSDAKVWAALLSTKTALPPKEVVPSGKPTPDPAAPAPAPASFTTRSKGSTGSSVKTLQRLLNSAVDANLTVDGRFGTATEAAVKKFQKAKKLQQTGSVTTATWTKLVPTLKSGSTAAAVKPLQYELQEAGVYSATASGKFDATTVAAVKKFQGAHKLTVTGHADAHTWAKLLSSNASVTTFPELVKGNKGNNVRTLQRLLNARAGKSLVVDGVFGTATQSALKGYQKAQKIAQTGVADTATWTKLAPSLKQGSKDKGSVKALQRALGYKGYSVDATGNFASLTKKQVEKFQKAKKLTVNGQVTATVWKLLLS